MSFAGEALTIINAPVEVVYRAASDLAHYPIFMVAARSVTLAPGAAQSYRWVTRSGVRRHAADIEVIERVPNERVAWRSRPHGANEGSFALEALGDQTHVSLRWSCSYPGLHPTRAAAQSLANLKRAVETGQRQRALDPLVLAGALVAASVVLAGGVVGARVLGRRATTPGSRGRRVRTARCR